MPTTSELMRAAMARHKITGSRARDKAKQLAAEQVEQDFERFAAGGPCSLGIAVAIIMLIVEKEHGRG